MIILPAIDIKDGNCVRLFKGDFSTVEKVAADYMETAKGFEAAVASWIPPTCRTACSAASPS